MTPVKPTILIVDDQHESRSAIATMLGQAGFVCIEAATGDDALMLARENYLSVALVDVVMPGLDGHETVALLRELPGKEDLSVIMMTGSAQEVRSEQKGYAIGAVDYLYKPINPVALIAKVRNFCNLDMRRESYVQEMDRINMMQGRLEAGLWGQDIVFQHLNLGVMILGVTGKIERTNAYIEHLLGYTESYTVGRSMDFLFVSPLEYSDFCNAAQADFSAGRGHATERALRKHDNAFLWTQLFGAPIHVNGAHEGIVWAIADATEQQAAREAIERFSRELESMNQRLEQTMVSITRKSDEAQAAAKAKSTFVANMSHEIRTPLHAIIGMSDILQNMNLTAEQNECAAIIHRSGQALLTLVNDILDFSKIEAGKLALERISFDLRSCLEDLYDIVGPQAWAKQLRFTLLVCHDVPERVQGDPVRLRQIMVNLVSNAIKFTEQGDVVVRVSVSDRTDSGVRLMFEVRDTGIGIPEEKIPCLFVAFEQVDGSSSRKYGGTGLGLAIADQITRAMGGTIRVRSVVGQGTSFFCDIPFEHGTPCWEYSTGAAASLQGLRTLVVDTNLISLVSLTEQMESYGCVAVGAAGFYEAKKAIEQARENNESFDGVLFCQHGADDSIAQWITSIKQAAGEPLPFLVLLTSAPFRGEAAKMETAGFDAYLTRPLRGKFLREALGQLAERQTVSPRKRLLTRHNINEHQRKQCILLVEDNEINQVVAGKMLTQLGCRYDLAQNGGDALGATESKLYDIILMDCFLPDVSGIDVTKKIRAGQGPNVWTPIVAMTAAADEETQKQCSAAGMTGFLTKPVELDQLRNVLIGRLDADRLREAPPSFTSGTTPVQPVESDGTPPEMESPQIGSQETDASARAPLDSCPPISHERLHSISGGDKAFEYDLLSAFLTDCGERAESLTRALDEGDRDLWKRLNHANKGASANVGAMKLHEIALRLEKTDIDRNILQARNLLDEWMLEFGQVRRYVGETWPG